MSVIGELSADLRNLSSFDAGPARPQRPLLPRPTLAPPSHHFPLHTPFPPTEVSIRF